MVGIDTDFVSFGLERVLTVLHWSELMLSVEIGPTPQLAIENVRKTLLLRNLKARTER